MQKNRIFSITVVVVAAVMAFNTSAFSQIKYFKGYVLLLNGDTLKGELKKNMKKEFDNFARASFRKSEGGEMKTFRADKIKEYCVDGVVFVSRNVEGEQVFVKRISTGAV